MSAKNVTITVSGNVVATAGFIKWIQGTGTTYTVSVDTQTDYITVTDTSTGTTYSGGTPALTLSTSNSAGSAATFLRTDDTILVFDATAPAAVGTAAAGSAATAPHRDHVHATGAGTPSTQASGDAAATGTGPAAAMTDHKHAFPNLYIDVTFSVSGALVASTVGVFRWYNRSGRTLTIETVNAAVGTAPATQSILCDVNIDGTTIWATQGNRVAIAAAANVGVATTFDTTTIATGAHYFTVDVDQVGTGTTGSNLTVTIWLKG